MRTLILGTGGREHAIAWKLGQTVGRQNITVHPGNPGIAAQGFSTGPAQLQSPEETARWARDQKIVLAIVGPEALLAEGYADALRTQGIAVVGPNQAAARLETSKAFCKDFLSRAGIPTAPYRVVETPDEVRLSTQTLPQVLKLDGLAAGKGVVIAHRPTDVEDFIRRVWLENEFGPGPHQVVVEGFLPGFEMSFLGFCDGHTFVPLATATDYKPVGDGNTGPNTGGMGAVSPSPYLTDALIEKIDRTVIQPTLKQMQADQMDFRGILFVGLMVQDGNPQVLEFNTRFGDPETQAILLRLESPLETLFEYTANGTLSEVPPPVWSERPSLYVVVASEGYPGKPRTGDPIEGLKTIPPTLTAFFSGVTEQEGNLVTQGGRVLGLGMVGEDLSECREQIYAALERVRWPGRHFRKDIGLKVAMEEK